MYFSNINVVGFDLHPSEEGVQNAAN